MDGKRLGIIGIALAVAALIWVAIEQTDGNGGQTLAQAQAPGSEQSNVISVTGEGRVAVPPDQATVNVGITLVRDTVAEAREEAAQLADAVIAAVKDAGVDDADIQTSQLSIYPEYNYRTNGNPILTGYRVTNTLNVVVRDLDQLGAVVDGAAAAGGDATTVNGISFGLQDPAEAQGQARERAFEVARAKAEQLADLAGVQLGRPVYIAESSSYQPPVPYAEYAAAQAADTATPIEPGTTEVAINLTVNFAIN